MDTAYKVANAVCIVCKLSPAEKRIGRMGTESIQEIYRKYKRTPLSAQKTPPILARELS